MWWSEFVTVCIQWRHYGLRGGSVVLSGSRGQQMSLAVVRTLPWHSLMRSNMYIVWTITHTLDYINVLSLVTESYTASIHVCKNWMLLKIAILTPSDGEEVPRNSGSSLEILCQDGSQHALLKSNHSNANFDNELHQYFGSVKSLTMVTLDILQRRRPGQVICVLSWHQPC